MAPLAIAYAGADQEELLAQIASGQTRVGVAIGDAVAARQDAGVTSAENRLTGKALFAMDCPADHYLVADSRQHLFLAAADAVGLTCQALPTIDRTRPTAELTFDAAPAQLLSDDPEVFARVVDAGRVMLAADTLGAAQSMLDQAIDEGWTVSLNPHRSQYLRPLRGYEPFERLVAPKG